MLDRLTTLAIAGGLLLGAGTVACLVLFFALLLSGRASFTS